MITRMLVPVDGSSGSDQACAFAAQLATATGASIVLLHVVEITGAEAMGIRSLDADDVQERVQNMAKGALARAGEAMGAPEQPLRVEEVVRIGAPADEILACIASESPDLVVMGSRGLSPLRELMLGSVSEKVVRRATCPVTVVR